MDEPKMRVITEMTTRVHTLNQARAAELAGAARHREAGDYTRAAIAEHAAHVNARMAVIHQEVAGILSGTWLPSPDDVSEPPEDNGLGVRVGIVAWAPPDGATPAQLHRWREFCDALQQSAIRQKYRTDDAIPGAHATQSTGQLAPEDLPQPDPLTATPAESAGSAARPAVPATPAPLYQDNGLPMVWSDAVAPGGYVCAVYETAGGPGIDMPDGTRICGRPVESEPCDAHGPGGVARTPDEVAAAFGPPRVTTVQPTAGTGAAELVVPPVVQRAYPDRPANGGPVEPERSPVGDDLTQVFPAPVAEDGDDRG